MESIDEKNPEHHEVVEEGKGGAEDAAAGTTNRAAGGGADNKLSVVSRAYDRGNKGYLDSTELKLRELDKDNQGTLDVNDMYMLMKGFQEEQKKALTLKYVVIALAGFAVLLCLANIGTSFAAATLAKDVTTSPDGLLVGTSNGEALATTNKDPIFDLDPADGSATSVRNLNNTERRLVMHAQEIHRRNVYRGLQGGGVNTVVNTIAQNVRDNSGTYQIRQKEMNQIMTSLCSNWPGVLNYNCNSGLRGCRFGTSNRIRVNFGWCVVAR